MQSAVKPQIQIALGQHAADINDYSSEWIIVISLLLWLESASSCSCVHLLVPVESAHFSVSAEICKHHVVFTCDRPTVLLLLFVFSSENTLTRYCSAQAVRMNERQMMVKNLVGSFVKTPMTRDVYTEKGNKYQISSALC